MVLKCILLLGIPAIAVYSAPIYTITNLGTLGGTSSSAYGINNKGVTVGSSTLPGEYDRAFVRTSGISQLNASGANTSTARAINSTGDVAGTTYTFAGAQ